MKPRCTTECAEDFKRVEAEKAALILRATQQRDDFRWLIEAPGPHYLAVQSITSSHTFEWTTDHEKALAFRSEQQADAMMMALRQLDRQLEAWENRGKLSWGKLFAFEPSLGNAKAVEHGWVSAKVA